jgi:hypothetical protein
MGLGDRAAALGREILNPAVRPGYNCAMAGVVAKAALIIIALAAATSADAQSRRKREPRETERAPAAAPIDKRDSVVAAPGPFSGKPYWLALAQCGGVYFKLNLLYTDVAVRARAVKPDPKTNAEYTKKLTEAIKIGTVYFDATERFLMNDRGLERADAVLTYDAQSRAAGDRLKTIDAALAATNACPVLYQACQEAYPKSCSETLAPAS